MSTRNKIVFPTGHDLMVIRHACPRRTMSRGVILRQCCKRNNVVVWREESGLARGLRGEGGEALAVQLEVGAFRWCPTEGKDVKVATCCNGFGRGITARMNTGGPDDRAGLEIAVGVIVVGSLYLAAVVGSLDHDERAEQTEYCREKSTEERHYEDQGSPAEVWIV
ncbi:MAG: hypothetical protein Q9174_002225 [Haloplaca sp. 1 TL-2023]